VFSFGAITTGSDAGVVAWYDDGAPALRSSPLNTKEPLSTALRHFYRVRELVIAYFGVPGECCWLEDLRVK
jgi:hypothetical protein